jgi:CheY-like chemotaxis protein
MNTESQPAAKAARILVVEDEAIVSADIQDRLQALGYEVAGCADTGEDAIKQAMALKPDLILMDIMLKDAMTGTEAAGHIRSYLQIPVIYLTANSNDETFLQARDTGPFGFILKPFEEPTLKVNIEIALYKHRMEREREDLIKQLQTALAQVKTLSGMMPICCTCKKIRDDRGYWNQIETYILKNSNASFSHGYCQECAVKYLEENGLEVPAEMRAVTKKFEFATQA